MNNTNRYTIYIDESGTCGLTDTRSRFFILTGFAVDNESDKELSGYFNFLKRKYGIRATKTFHSYDLFENKKSSIYLSDAQANHLSSSLSEFINIIPAKVIVVALDKNKLRKHFKITNKKLPLLGQSDTGKQVRDLAYDILAAKIFFWFSINFLKKKNNTGSIIAESRLSSDHSLLTSYLYCRDPYRFANSPKQIIQQSSTLMRQKITGIKFENKIAQCSGLELSDLVSYISNIVLAKRTREFKNRGIARLWKKIKNKIEDSKIQIVDGQAFLDYLPASRVYKISKFCEELSSK